MDLMTIALMLIGLIGAGKVLYDRRQKWQNQSQPKTDPMPEIPDSTDDLLAKLEHHNWRVREAAVRKVMEQNVTDALPQLMAMLGDSDSDVRDAVVAALVQMGDKFALRAKLDDPNQDVRVASVRILGDMRDHGATDALITLLKEDVSSWVRMAAAEALGEIRNQKSTRALKEAALADSDRTVQAVIRRQLDD